MTVKEQQVLKATLGAELMDAGLRLINNEMTDENRSLLFRLFQALYGLSAWREGGGLMTWSVCQYASLLKRPIPELEEFLGEDKAAWDKYRKSSRGEPSTT